MVSTAQRWRDLLYIGFLGPAEATNRSLVPDGMEVLVQDELAGPMSDMTISCLDETLDRFLWLLRGWPARSCLVLNPEIAPAEIQRSRDDLGGVSRARPACVGWRIAAA